MILLPVATYSQENVTCAEKLREAQSLFDRGQVEKVPEMLAGCMRSGFRREEQLEAYKLLIQSHLLEDKYDEADSTMLAFLKRYPEYQLSQTDHQSFASLFNSFSVKPLFRLGFHIGTNIPFLTSVDVNVISPEAITNSYSTEFLNLFTSLEITIPVKDKIEACVEAAWLQTRFTNREKFLGFETVYTERSERLEIPFTATFPFAKYGKNFTAFIRAGAGAALNLKVAAKAVTTGTDSNNRIIISGADLDVSGSRIFTDFFLVAGAGIRYKTPGGFISLESRVETGLRNYTVHDSNSASRELACRYSFSDDDFRMNNVNITIGYTHIFYKPGKRKQEE
ncbi:MAG: hypothetical protein JXR66_06265 [Bacteroidales bacterium]|nr:hypothetical protein [Bacteroidales bacterium]MBN2633140.1 hypothetical protein [Bacteroidales bacterium]